MSKQTVGEKVIQLGIIFSSLLIGVVLLSLELGLKIGLGLGFLVYAVLSSQHLDN